MIKNVPHSKKAYKVSLAKGYIEANKLDLSGIAKHAEAMLRMQLKAEYPTFEIEYPVVFSKIEDKGDYLIEVEFYIHLPIKEQVKQFNLMTFFEAYAIDEEQNIQLIGLYTLDEDGLHLKFTPFYSKEELNNLFLHKDGLPLNTYMILKPAICFDDKGNRKDMPFTIKMDTIEIKNLSLTNIDLKSAKNR